MAYELGSLGPATWDGLVERAPAGAAVALPVREQISVDRGAAAVGTRRVQVASRVKWWAGRA